MKALKRKYLRGIVTHLDDQRYKTLNIVLWTAHKDGDSTEALPISYNVAPPHEQDDLPEVAASVKVGDEVGAWYVFLAGDSTPNLMGRTLEVIL